MSKAIEAHYNPSCLRMYRDNALIEALPDYLVYTNRRIIDQLRLEPDKDSLNKVAVRRQRAAWLMSLHSNLFIPLLRHLNLQETIDLMIRQGYRSRNPVRNDALLRDAYLRQREAELKGEMSKDPEDEDKAKKDAETEAELQEAYTRQREAELNGEMSRDEPESDDMTKASDEPESETAAQTEDSAQAQTADAQSEDAAAATTAGQEEAESKEKKDKDKKEKLVVNYGGQSRVPLSAALIGCSGIGKTTAVERVLSFYPQVLHHKPSTRYNNNMSFDQVVYVKVECPHGGSIKDLCIDIIEKLGELTDNDYLQTFVKRTSTLSSLKIHLAHLIEQHKVGLLVVDEIQNLAGLYKNREEFFNFVVSLANGLGVPILYIGTPAAATFMKKDLRIARRFGSCGSFEWERLKQKECQEFMKELWKYNVLTAAPPEIPQDIADCLYYYSQGITDILVKLYILSQIRAMIVSKSTKGQEGADRKRWHFCRHMI